jgi:uncharacterized membrane protein YkoI
MTMRVSRWIMPAALLGLSGLSATAALADEKKISVEDLPKVVLKAAKKAFPEAKIVGASKETDEGETIYEVEMKLDGKSIDVEIDDEGEIEVVEKEIEVEDLPRAVIKAAKTKFPGGKIEKVEEVTDEDDVVVYELVIAAKGKSTEVVFSPNGKIQKDEEDDEEEDEKGKDKAKKKEKDEDDDKGKDKAKKKEKDDDDKAKKKEKGEDDDKGKGKKKGEEEDDDDDEKGEKKEKPKS